MNEEELKQLFENRSDCYADTSRLENDGSYSEGEVIQAMTLERYLEVFKELKELGVIKTK